MMTRFRRTCLPAAAAFFLFAAGAPAFAQDRGAAALFPDPVVASGRGFEIKRSTVQDAYITEKALMLRQQNVVIPESERARVESDILLHIVVDKILVQRATPEEITSVSNQVAKYIEDLRKAAPSESLFQEQIQATGKTLEQVKTAYLEKRLARVVLARELVSSNAVSDAAVKQFYDDPKNATNFAIPEQVRVAHILISVIDPDTRRQLPAARKMDKEKLARDIKARADKGEDFAALAKQYSDDAGTRDKGGEHTFARNTTGPGLEGFEAASFSLKTNQISDLVETPYGYDIIKLLEKRPASKMPLDDNVAAGIRDYLANDEINKQLPAYIPKIEAEYNVKFLDANYSPTPLAAPGATAIAPGR
jgi:peptidyl-prolyl cis-trans isomerase C